MSHPTVVPATQAGSAPVVNPTVSVPHSAAVGDPTHPPSSIKGNVTALMGKMTHNPAKEHNGNIMIANAAEQKAARFETKALEWERKGNNSKAIKNREKVN